MGPTGSPGWVSRSPAAHMGHTQDGVSGPQGLLRQRDREDSGPRQQEPQQTLGPGVDYHTTKAAPQKWTCSKPLCEVRAPWKTYCFFSCLWPLLFGLPLSDPLLAFSVWGGEMITDFNSQFSGTTRTPDSTICSIITSFNMSFRTKEPCVWWALTLPFLWINLSVIMELPLTPGNISLGLTSTRARPNKILCDDGNVLYLQDPI